MSMTNSYIEEYENALFKTAIIEAAKLEGDKLMAKAEAFAKDKNIQCDVDKVQKQLNKAVRRNNVKKASKAALKIAKKVAAVLVVVIALSVTVIMSVDAARKSVTEFLMSFYPEYTEVEIDDISGDGGAIYNDQMAEITENCIPRYIPDDFKVKTFSMNEGEIELYCENEEGSAISFSAYSRAAVSQIDTQNADETKVIDISGREGLLTSKEGVITISWSDDEHLFILISQLGESETIRIAESVKADS